MPFSLTLVTPPMHEPLRLDEVKLHLRLSITEDDVLLLGLIQAAREYLETVTRRQFLTATWRYSLACFPRGTGWGGYQGSWGGAIELPRPPLASLTATESAPDLGIAYVDSAGATQTLDPLTYGVDTDSTPGRVYLLPTASWPSVYSVPNPVRITYQAGYATPQTLFARHGSLRSALLLLVSHLYEQREASAEKVLTMVPYGLETLIWSNRLLEVV